MSELATGGCESACIYSSGDDNPAEICGVLIVKARKPAKCCECCEPIHTGERYEVTSGKWEGGWASFKTCLPCKEIRETFCCEGWTYGTLWRDAAVSIFERLTTGCVAKLGTAAAKEKLIERWRRWKGIEARA